MGGLFVMNVIEDCEYYIWCMIFEKGVFMCLQLGMIVYNNFYGLYWKQDLLMVVNNRVIVFFCYDELIFLECDYFLEKIQFKGSLVEMIIDVCVFGKEWFVGYKE